MLLFEWHCGTRSSVAEIRLNTTCEVHRLAVHGCLFLRLPVLQFGAAFSSPAFSSLAFSVPPDRPAPSKCRHAPAVISGDKLPVELIRERRRGPSRLSIYYYYCYCYFYTRCIIDPRGYKLKKLKPGWNGYVSISSSAGKVSWKRMELCRWMSTITRWKKLPLSNGSPEYYYAII